MQQSFGTVPRSFLLSLIVVFTEVGCSHTWAPGPNVTEADFVPTRARCSLMARNGGDTISVAGSQRFVAGAIIGNAIGNAFKASADFNDCMQASGFLVADNMPRAGVAPAGLGQPARSPAAPASVAPVGILPLRDNSPVPPSTPNGLLPQEAAFVVPMLPSQPLASKLEDLKACESDLRHNEYFEAIAAHLPDADGKYAFSQIADAGSPTVDERKVFATYVDTTKKCVDHLAQYLQYNDPSLAASLTQARDDQDRHLLSLVTGHSTWGEYAQSDAKTRAYLKATFFIDIEP